jgi:DNA-directed RNA polymerase sigma subunit (sigma70/sigma32)
MTTPDHWLHSQGMTLREVARELGISPARVRAIEVSALEKLRSVPWMRRRLSAFVDFDTLLPTTRAKEGSHR